MKFTGGQYITSDGKRFLAIYNYQHDVYMMPPPEFKGANHIIHFSYSRGGKKGGGDVFLLNDSMPNPKNTMNITKEISVRDGKYHIDDLRNRKKFDLEKGQLKNSIEKYDMYFQIASFPKTITEKALTFSKVDIAYFCGEQIATKHRGLGIEYVDKIIPKTEIKRTTPNKFLEGGKHWFIPFCPKANTDEGQGCATGWIPGENHSFDGKFFVNYFSSPPDECNYCYSSDKHKCPSKTVNLFDRQRFSQELQGDCCLEYNSNKKHGELVKLLRFGKRTEPWMPGVTEDSVVGKLEVMVETGTRGIIVTKFLPYIKYVDDLVKRTGSRVMHSIGFDFAEKGACAQGYDNEWRVKQAIKYKEVLFLLLNAHLPPGERENKILNTAKKYKLSVQLLPLRFKQNKGKGLVRQMTGQTWDFLKEDSPENRMRKGQFNLSDFKEPIGRGSYILYNGELVAKKIHPYWLNLIGDNNGNIRMCHHNDELTYCGGCFQGKGFITKTIHVKKEKSQRYKKKEKPVKVEDHPVLFED